MRRALLFLLLTLFSTACGDDTVHVADASVAPDLGVSASAIACAGPSSVLAVQTFDGAATDLVRNRKVAYRVRYAPGWTGCAPILFLSHGGDGATDGGQLALPHLGEEYAGHGYLAIHVNHMPSTSDRVHESDRPKDVSFLLDQLTAGKLALPADQHAALSLTRVGHTGHSWGASTAHALGGATWDTGVFRDPRVLAVAPISPQGPGLLGGYDNGPDDNSWRTVAVPAYSFVGSLEKDDSIGEVPPVHQLDWRLFPFQRYLDTPDKYLSLVSGQDHDMMGDGGSAEVKAFVATNTRRFFDAYVRGDTREVCSLSTPVPVTTALPGVDQRKKSAPAGIRASAGCP